MRVNGAAKGPGCPRSRGKCPKDKGGAGAKRQRGMPAEAGNLNPRPTQIANHHASPRTVIPAKSGASADGTSIHVGATLVSPVPFAKRRGRFQTCPLPFAQRKGTRSEAHAGDARRCGKPQPPPTQPVNHHASPHTIFPAKVDASADRTSIHVGATLVSPVPFAQRKGTRSEAHAGDARRCGKPQPPPTQPVNHHASPHTIFPAKVDASADRTSIHVGATLVVARPPREAKGSCFLRTEHLLTCRSDVPITSARNSDLSAVAFDVDMTLM